ncbi:MAG: sulfatase-like hydrolase/transferase [Bacteroides sp.]|nr:sulfatase-like hydrolase/transferase [Bacteroides sp.]
MTIRLNKCILSIVLSLILVSSCSHETVIDKPNIIIFYADDLGWQDTEINDVDDPCPWETPNIKRLAELSINFTQAYSPAPVCAPSRIALVSGVHPARLGKISVRGGTPEVVPASALALISPYQLGHMNADEYTVAAALRDHGYSTAHVGKWHIGSAATKTSSADVGFGYVSETRGITNRMKPDRLSDFPSNKEGDPYRVDENGRPYDPTTGDAMKFLEQSANLEQPFFLYLAHWLVHAPIQTRDSAFLAYNCKKMGLPFPTDPGKWTIPGQNNPYYASMVGTLDWSLGKVLDFLEITDDPRYPGKKLSETTYIIFSSDNGGMEWALEETTDNAPLEKGKISAREGGIRVPLLVRGPGIKPGLSREIVSGLDFYPTLLAMSGAPGRQEQNARFDGVNILPHLLGKEAEVKDLSGQKRDILYWHFPFGRQDEFRSAIRKGDFKLLKNYLTSDYSLFRLDGPEGERLDWEEENDLIANPGFSEIREELIENLEAFLQETDAKPGYFNSRCTNELPGQNQVPAITAQSYDRETNKATVTFETEAMGKTKVKRVYLTYTKNGGSRGEDWYQIPAEIGNGSATVNIPEGTSHYIFTLIDKNNFIQSPVKESPGNRVDYTTQAIAIRIN